MFWNLDTPISIARTSVIFINANATCSVGFKFKNVCGSFKHINLCIKYKAQVTAISDLPKPLAPDSINVLKLVVKLSGNIS